MNRRLGLPLVVLSFCLWIHFLGHAQWYQGPSGGNGGQTFDQWKASGEARDIRTVSVLQDGSIRCLSVLYRDRSGSFQNGYCNPGPGPLSFNGGAGISLDPDEYVIGISGRYDDHVNSLRIYTNKKNSPIFGGSGGKFDFGYTAPQGQMIVAFYGRAGTNLDAIGVLYAPCLPQKKPCR